MSIESRVVFVCRSEMYKTFSSKAEDRPESNLARERLIHLGTANKYLY